MQIMHMTKQENPVDPCDNLEQDYWNKIRQLKRIIKKIYDVQSAVNFSDINFTRTIVFSLICNY